MRLIAQEGDTLAKLQPNEFAGERLLTGVSFNFCSRPEADFSKVRFGATTRQPYTRSQKLP